MHNLISYNQLDEWRHFEQTLDDMETELDLINDYYECLIVIILVTLQTLDDKLYVNILKLCGEVM